MTIKYRSTATASRNPEIKIEWKIKIIKIKNRGSTTYRITIPTILYQLLDNPKYIYYYTIDDNMYISANEPSKYVNQSKYKISLTSSKQVNAPRKLVDDISKYEFAEVTWYPLKQDYVSGEPGLVTCKLLQ